jgi:Family of unknown function (DUF6461)
VAFLRVTDGYGLCVDDDAWTGSQDGLCVSLVHAWEPSDAVRALCPDDVLAFDSASNAIAWVRESASFDRTWLAAGAVDAWTFVWEDNGYQGADPDRARSLAAGTTFVSMFWNVNSVMSFILARDGQIVRHFDPLFHDDDPSPVPPTGLALPAEEGLDWESSPRQSGLALLALLAGTDPVTPAWLSQPGVTYWGHHF